MWTKISGEIGQANPVMPVGLALPESGQAGGIGLRHLDAGALQLIFERIRNDKVSERIDDAPALAQARRNLPPVLFDLAPIAGPKPGLREVSQAVRKVRCEGECACIVMRCLLEPFQCEMNMAAMIPSVGIGRIEGDGLAERAQRVAMAVQFDQRDSVLSPGIGIVGLL